MRLARLLILLCSAVSILLAVPTSGSSTSSRSTVDLCTENRSISFTVEIPPFDLETLDNGEALIRMENAAREQRPGYPWLPVLTYTYALPPGCEATCVEVTGARSPVAGTHLITATPPPLPLSGSPAMEEKLWSAYQANRARVYSGAEPLPQELGVLYRSSERREYSLVTVAVYPFHYDPVLRRLEAASHVTVRIEYAPVAPDRAELLRGFLYAGTTPEGVPAYVCNPDQARAWYRPAERPLDQPGIIVLTVDRFVPHLGDYIAWREATGFRVWVVTKEEILASGVQGVDTQQIIRNWLRANAAGYQYLFIVAHHSDIPMRVLSPWNEDPWGEPLYYPFLSDIYYGDLSKPDNESWDVDGDGNYGEVEYIGGASSGLDDPDLELELHVGRVNASSEGQLPNVFSGIASFESSTDQLFKASSVLGSGIVFYYDGGSKCDGAYLSEYMQNEGIFDSSLAVTLYEVEGDNPSDYPCDTPLNHTTLVSALASGAAGVFFEFNHGWMDGFARTVWNDNNGDGDPQDWELQSSYVLTNSDCPQLDSSNRNVSFLISCLCGNVESNCIAQNLVETGSAGVVAHTRVAHAIRSLAADRVEPGDGGVDDLFYYEVGAYLQEEATYDYVLGDAVDASRAYYTAVNPGGVSHCNAYGHALFGDPALRHYGREAGTTPAYSGIEVTRAELALRVGADNRVRFSVPGAGKVRIDAWDVSGRRVQTLWDGWTAAGSHSLSWDNDKLASGLYVLTLRTGSATHSTRAVVLK